MLFLSFFPWLREHQAWPNSLLVRVTDAVTGPCNAASVRSSWDCVENSFRRTLACCSDFVLQCGASTQHVRLPREGVSVLCTVPDVAILQPTSVDHNLA